MQQPPDDQSFRHLPQQDPGSPFWPNWQPDQPTIPRPPPQPARPSILRRLAIIAFAVSIVLFICLSALILNVTLHPDPAASATNPTQTAASSPFGSGLITATSTSPVQQTPPTATTTPQNAGLSPTAYVQPTTPPCGISCSQETPLPTQRPTPTPKPTPTLTPIPTPTPTATPDPTPTPTLTPIPT